jgi:uncharacterized protein YbjT (DUF2867 family)
MPRAPILVIGGSSGTGRAVVERLRQQRVATRVLSRDPARARRRLPRGVDVCGGDLTRPDTLRGCLDGVAHIVLTAGVYSGHPATNAHVKAMEYDGVVNVLAEATRVGFGGRLLYMTASGLRARSMPAIGLNLWKRNTLTWRWRVEDRIRASSVDYAIIRVGVLFDRQAGWRAIHVTQDELPLSLRYRIARTDVAKVFAAALEHPAVSRVGCSGQRTSDLPTMLNTLRPDGFPD